MILRAVRVGAPPGAHCPVLSSSACCPHHARMHLARSLSSLTNGSVAGAPAPGSIPTTIKYKYGIHEKKERRVFGAGVYLKGIETTRKDPRVEQIFSEARAAHF